MTSRYLDDLLNIDNPYFEGMVNQSQHHRYRSPHFFYLHLCIANGLLFFFSNFYDKRDDIDFDIVNFPFLDGDVPRRVSDGTH